MGAGRRPDGASDVGGPLSGSPGGSRLTISHSDAESDAEWDAFVARLPRAPHVQTSMWGALKSLLGWRGQRIVVRRDGGIVGGCQLLVRRVGPAAVAYAPRGPLGAPGDQEALVVSLEATWELARRLRVSYLKLQPPSRDPLLEAHLERRGFVASALEAAPTASVLVNLADEPDAVLARMRSGVRANIRKAQRKGVTIRRGDADDIASFSELVRATGERQGFAAYPAAYYRRMYELFGADGGACLLLAEHDGRLLSALLLIGHGDTAVYKMGGWAGERSAVRPNELAHWSGMGWARERGHRYYDFDSFSSKVAAAVARGEEIDPSQNGVAWFKLGFGGEVHVFPQAYDASPSPLLRPVVRRAAPRLDALRGLARHVLGRG